MMNPISMISKHDNARHSMVVITRRPAVKTIIEEVCDRNVLTKELLFKKSKNRRLVRARYEAWTALRAYALMTTQEIADLFGVHHTTVMHGMKKYEEDLLA